MFVLIVAAMFLRGASLPDPRRARRAAPARGAAPEALGRARDPVARRLRGRARRAAVRLPAGADQLADRDVMALSLVVITGFVGQISVVQLALAGVAGFTVSHLAVDAGIGFPLAPLAGIAAAVVLGLVTAVSALRVRGVSLAVVTLAAAVAIYNFGFVNTHLGRRRDRLAGAGAAPASASTSGRPRRSAASTATCRARSSAGSRCRAVRAVPARRVGAPRHRSDSGCSRCAPTSAPRPAAAINVRERQADRVRHQRVHRRRRRGAVRLQLRLGERRPLQRATALSLIAFAYAGGITLVSGAVFAGLISAQGSSRTRSTSGSACRGTGSCSSAASCSSSR